MKQETIEKAAKSKPNYTWSNPILTIELSINTGNGFTDGARRSISSVWHDMREEPNGMSVILIDFGNDVGEEYGLGVTSDDLVGAKRWAYIADLLPERKEGAK